MFKKIKASYQIKKSQARERRLAIAEAKKDPTRFDKAPVFTWSAPLRRKQHKGPIWIALTIIVIAALLFYGSTTQNWIFVIAIIAAVIVYTIDHFETTAQIEIKISEFGVKIGSHAIPFSNIKAFWIVYQPPYVTTLHIRTFNKTMPDISIDLDDQDPAKIREFLTRHIVEWEGKTESLLDVYTRVLKL